MFSGFILNGLHITKHNLKLVIFKHCHTINTRPHLEIYLKISQKRESSISSQLNNICRLALPRKVDRKKIAGKLLKGANKTEQGTNMTKKILMKPITQIPFM